MLEFYQIVIALIILIISLSAWITLYGVAIYAFIGLVSKFVADLLRRMVVFEHQVTASQEQDIGQALRVCHRPDRVDARRLHRQRLVHQFRKVDDGVQRQRSEIMGVWIVRMQTFEIEIGEAVSFF